MANGGGNYNNGTNAGVFYSNGNNNSRTNTNTNIGLRVALPRSKGQGGRRSRVPAQMATSWPIPRGKGSIPRAPIKQKRKTAAAGPAAYPGSPRKSGFGNEPRTAATP